MAKRKHAINVVLEQDKAVEPAKRSMSANFWFILLAVVAVAGYFVGANNNQIYGVIAPVFGQKVYTSDVDLDPVEATFRALKANYDGDLTDAELIDGASRGLVDAVGDDYTVYMDAQETLDFNNDLSGNIGGGIGAEISIRNSRVAIVRILRDHPAESAGLMAGDVILKINDESTDDWTVSEAVGKIRGEVGTTVKLSVLRTDEVKEFSVTRDTVINPSAYSSIKDGVGILVLNRFDSDTYDLARLAASEFVEADVTGVVLDLRGNGGGYLDSAKEIAGLWLNDKVVVSERSGDTVIAELKSSRVTLLEGLPTAVLVNSSSASASEILAGALQDHKAATVVGGTTFGKGSVQKLISLPDGAQLKVTIARWYTPNGKNITEEGITPDIEASLTQANLDTNQDPQLDAAIKSLQP